MSEPLLKHISLSKVRDYWKFGLTSDTKQSARMSVAEWFVTVQKVHTRHALGELCDYAQGVCEWLEGQDVSGEFIEEFRLAIEKARKCE